MTINFLNSLSRYFRIYRQHAKKTRCQQPARPRNTRLQLEAFEDRLVPSVTAAQVLHAIPNPALQTLARQDYTRDHAITYGDMLGLFAKAESEGPVSNATMQSLEIVVNYGSTLHMPASVHQLACKVVNGDSANATYQSLNSKGIEVSTTLGNLKVGSSRTHLTDLVNKWFRGENEPVAPATLYNNLSLDTGSLAYSSVNDPLFGKNGPVFTDVHQGIIGDCWLLSSLAEAAARQPSLITRMFTFDGTNVVNGQTVDVYTVRFYATNGKADYVTVDTELPAAGNDYDQPASGVLWVALAEKAYAEANGEGAVATGNENKNNYGALYDGWGSWALSAITGKSASDFNINTSNVASAFQDGQLVVMSTPSNPTADSATNMPIVGDHYYALVGYNPSSNMPFEVFNPWGTNSQGYVPGTNNQIYGLFVANTAFIAQNFDGYSGASQAAPGVAGMLSQTTNSATGASKVLEPARPLIRSSARRRPAKPLALPRRISANSRQSARPTRPWCSTRSSPIATCRACGPRQICLCKPLARTWFPKGPARPAGPTLFYWSLRRQ